jgi:hypothetical protein
MIFDSELADNLIFLSIQTTCPTIFIAFVFWIITFRSLKSEFEVSAIEDANLSCPLIRPYIEQSLTLRRRHYFYYPEPSWGFCG